MVLEDIQSDLCALRKLYGLLQNGEDGLQIARFEVLDEKARILLKDLLDGATERVFEAHSKIIASHLGAYNAPCSTRSGHPKETQKLQNPVSAYMSRTYPCVTMSSTNGPKPQKIASQEDDKQPSIQAASESQNREKRCHACQQNIVKQLYYNQGKKCSDGKMKNLEKAVTSQPNRVSEQVKVKELESEKKAIEKERQKRIREMDRSRVGASACSSNSPIGDGKSAAKHNFAGKIEQKPAGTDSISKEVSDAIKQIEFRILALKLASEHVGPLSGERSPAQHGVERTGSPSQAGDFDPSRTGSPSQRGSLWVQNLKVSSQVNQVPSQLRETKMPNKTISQTLKPLPTTNNSLSQLDTRKIRRNIMSQVPGQNVKAIVEKIESLSRVTGENNHTPSQTHRFVQGLRVPQGQKEIARMAHALLAKLPSPTGKENRDQNKMDQREKGMPHQTNFRKTRVHHNPSQTVLSQTLGEDRVDKKQSMVQKFDRMGPRRKVLTRQRDSDGSSPSFRPSSTSTSQQASTSNTGSGSEGSSLSGVTPSQQSTGSTSISESEEYPSPGRVQGHYMGLTSSSGPTGSIESESYSPSDRSAANHHMDVTPRLVSPTSRRANYRSGDRVKPEIKIGRLRKLKDKLAIVFHHHHHHHHHHHQQSKPNRATSLWKNAGKAFHRTGKHEAYGERAVDKIGKSVVHDVPDKNQHGHFHALVEGLLRHIRHSKKSRLHKGGIGRSGNRQHGGKNLAKKMHWWQMFRRHRKGMKLPNKPRVKLGLGGKKHQLRALPTLRVR